ncbi:MAG: hypothetical protein R2761_18005 [Acidimicrobiales bacterium]
MRSPTRSLRLGLAGLTLAALGLTVPAVAGAAPAGPAAPAVAASPGDGIGPRAERACLRIPNIEIRLTERKARLDGDATVRGSLAWLQSKIDAAQAANRDQLATVLENRLTVRSKTREILDDRTELVADLRSRCESWGVEI